MTKHFELQTNSIAQDWLPLVQHALNQMDAKYLHELQQNDDWLPGPQQIFNAFQLPLAQTQAILFGESPYPRRASANGFAFWDAATDHIWSETGLAKTVNRATSLRHFIKMLLVAEGLIPKQDTSQERIAIIDKSGLIQTTAQLFKGMMSHGILLLNASLVLKQNDAAFHAKAWRPFMQSLLTQLASRQPNLTLILWGKIAGYLQGLMPEQHFHCLISEHPYNMTFVNNSVMQGFFSPMHLLILN